MPLLPGSDPIGAAALAAHGLLRSVLARSADYGRSNAIAVTVSTLGLLDNRWDEPPVGGHD